MDFGAWLKNELDARHLTFQSFGKKSGLARSTLSKLASGHRRPTAYTAARIAAGLGVPVNLVLEKAGLLPSAVKAAQLNPLLETAIEQIGAADEKKQVLAAKPIRIIAEDD